MKTKLFLTAIMAAAALFAGCKKDGPKNPEELKVGYELKVDASTSFTVDYTVTPKLPAAEIGLFMSTVLEAQNYRDKADGDPVTGIRKTIEAYQAAYPGYSVEDLVSLMTSQVPIGGSTTTENRGQKSMQWTMLDPEKEYVVLVAGVNARGEITFAGADEFFTTPALPALVSQSCDFTITESEVTDLSVTVDVTPTDATTPYFIYHMSAAEYEATYNSSPETLSAGMYRLIKDLALDNGFPSVTALVKQEREQGAQTDVLFRNLKPETDYIAFACGLDEYARATTAIKVHAFSTLEFEQNPDVVISGAARLYDGDEAVALDPDRFPESVFANRNFISYKPSFAGACVAWTVAFSDESMDELTDGEIYSFVEKEGLTLSNNAWLNVPNNQFGYYPYTKDAAVRIYLYAVAFDENGIPGPIQKLNINTGDALSPISTIDDESYAR